MFLVAVVTSVAGVCRGAGASAHVAVPPTAGPVVVTSDGPVEGGSSQGVHFFRGIPFAAAPLGPLRCVCSCHPCTTSRVLLSHPLASTPIFGRCLPVRSGSPLPTRARQCGTLPTTFQRLTHCTPTFMVTFRRWKPPQRPTPWTTPFQASNWGSHCIQSSGIGSEDCLFVNVHTPANATPSSKLPVLL